MIEYDRYLLVKSVGDGRVLRSVPSWSKEKSGYMLRCPLLPSFFRIPAANLPTDLALSEGHDLFLKNGDIATVSGVAALPQKIKTNLSHQRGESPFHPNFGTRVAGYYTLLRESPWFQPYPTRGNPPGSNSMLRRRLERALHAAPMRQTRLRHRRSGCQPDEWMVTNPGGYGRPGHR